MTTGKSLLVLGLFSLLLAGCFHDKAKEPPLPTQTKRQIINALPVGERPFVALFPHSTGRLITLMVDKAPDAPQLGLDIEYLAGDALKGGRTTLTLPVALPYTQAFLLGSCSAGGKCSFDTNITTGTIKTKLELGTDIHVLKSDYVFVKGKSATSDQKLIFEPTRLTGQAILAQTHGYIGQLEGEPTFQPVAITRDTAAAVKGKLTIIAPETTKLVYYNGEIYSDLKFTLNGDQLVVDLDLTPWSRQVEIIRDDLQGTTETVTLYLVGPIVALK